MLAMSLSAVAACLCSHHDQPAAEKTSCHSSAHGDSPSAEVVDIPLAAGAGELCDCFVRTPVRFVTAKSQAKAVKPSEPVDAEAIGFTALSTLRVWVGFERSSDVTYNSRYLSRSGPSRAPPRL
jgi:hypothetical protein